MLITKNRKVIGSITYSKRNSITSGEAKKEVKIFYYFLPTNQEY